MARRPRRRWPWVLALAVVLAWGGVCAVLLVAARADLAKGVDAVEAARAAVPGAGTLEGGGLDQLRQAEAAFGRAHRRVSSPVMAPMRLLPVAGRQLRSVDALSGSAERVAGVGIQAVTAAAAELNRAEQTGPARVQLIEALARITADSSAQLDDVDLGPSKGLVGPLADARERFADDLDDARTALAKLKVVTAGLDAFLAGPRRYLVFAANNAEMRAGAGMPLSFGVLDVRDGHLGLPAMESVGILPSPPPGVPLDPDVAAAWGHLVPNRAWVNLNVSPRFPASAELATRMWAAVGRGQVDGVFFVDPVALKALLASTGPVPVPGGTMDADRVLQDVLHDQYRGRQSPAGDLRRRDRLSDITVAAVEAANQKMSLTRLGQDLYAAVRGRHLLAWASRPEEQRAWEAMSGDGALLSDSVMVSVLNRGANKLDPFLEVDASLELAGRDATLTLQVANRTPPGEPSYVLGPYQFYGVPAGSYTGIVTLNLPGPIEMIDPGPFVPRGRDGLTAVAVSNLQLRPGETRQLGVRFRLPAGRTAMWVEPSARVPPVRWRAGGQQWEDQRGRAVFAGP